MSLHQLANHMSAQGRGPDSTLVHMSPREVSGLQSLAMAHGGTLTVNPQTGLPEAGFLDSLLPTLIGGAATYFTGGAINPAVIASAVGGITALTSKDLGKGLMAGLGAYGGSSIVSGLAGFGAEALGSEAATAALPSGYSSASEMAGITDAASKTAQTGASYYDKLAAGASKAMSNPGDALSAFGDGNKFMGAAKLAGPVMAAFSAVDEPKTSIPEKSKTAFIRSFYKDPVTGQKMANPAIPAEDFGNRTLGEQYFAANGGLIALAGGGQTAYDYLDRKRSTSSDAGIVVDDTPPKPRLPPLGSDGKGSYTYNKDSKTWVWTPTAKPVVPVNSGVATLMDIGGLGGGQDRANPSGSDALPGYGAYQNQGSLAAFLSNMGLTSAGQAVATNLGNQLNPGLTLTGADISGGQFTAPETSPNPNTGLQGQGTEGQTGLYGDAAAGYGKSTNSNAGSYADPGAVTNAAADRQAADRQAASDDRENAREGISGLTTSSGTLDNLGDRPQSNPTASLPTVGYTGTGLSLLSDFLTGSPTSLTTAPVETREATLSPAATSGVNLDAGELSDRTPVTTSLSDRMAANSALASANAAKSTAIADQLAFEGAQAALAAEAQEAAQATAMANAAASLAAAEAPSFTPDTAPSAPTLDGPSGAPSGNPMGGDVTSSTPNGPSGAAPAGNVDTNAGEGGLGVGVGGGGADGGGGGCFLTTAAVSHMNQKDNGKVLNALREFRDTYMRKNKEKSKDIAWYYENAPRIVAALDARPDADKVYKKMYRDFIKPAYNAIQEGDEAYAYEIYKDGIDFAKKHSGIGTKALTPRYGPNGMAVGGIAALADGGLGSLGGYSDGGRLLRGPGDGVSDSIPATVGGRQPARLADGEFVVPARIVSELGNGSTEAGARALYKMMDRIQANRRKTTGKNSVAVNSKSHKYLPA